MDIINEDGEVVGYLSEKPRREEKKYLVSDRVFTFIGLFLVLLVFIAAGIVLLAILFGDLLILDWLMGAINLIGILISFLGIVHAAERAIPIGAVAWGAALMVNSVVIAVTLFA